jgi:membrane protein YqaA with SNARE-associated domain
VFLLNLIPIFGPPTWTVLAFVAFAYPIPSIPLFVFAALCGSTLGRIILTLSSKHILRNHLLHTKYRINMDRLKKHLDKRPYFSSIVFFVEAFTPLPSDQFFIAYGLTGMKLRYAIIPFFIARVFTYSFWAYTSSQLSRNLVQTFNFMSFLTLPFIIGEICIIILLYYFVKVDWDYLIWKRRFRVIR